MAIARKPKASDSEALKVIRKGGDVARTTARPGRSEDLKRVQLRLEQEVLDRIDQVIEGMGPPRPSRHFWMVEAIIHRLLNEEGKGTSS